MIICSMLKGFKGCMLLLMAEIRLTTWNVKISVNNGINYLVSRVSSINRWGSLEVNKFTLMSGLVKHLQTQNLDHKYQGIATSRSLWTIQTFKCQISFPRIKFPSCKNTNCCANSWRTFKPNSPCPAAFAGRFPTGSFTLAFALAFALALASTRTPRPGPIYHRKLRPWDTLRPYQNHDGSKGLAIWLYDSWWGISTMGHPKAWKIKVFGHLKPRLFTMKTSKHVSLGGPW